MHKDVHEINFKMLYDFKKHLVWDEIDNLL